MQALKETHLQLPRQTGFYKGKVRDVYEIGSNYLVMVATDRISAFDHILPEAIPAKGAVLNTLAAKFLEMTRDIAPNWLMSVPDGRASIGIKCQTYPVEMVIRGYLCGHALRQYQAGRRELCGVPMPEGMKPYDAFPEPIITPSTKAHEGHDEDISREEILERGLVPEGEYARLEQYTHALFAAGSRYAGSRDLILADTKYEFGKKNGEILLIDEVHTPDSSRYFYKEGFAEKVKKGESPEQLSKEFVREWLMSQGFMGRPGDKMPEMNEEVVEMIRKRYFHLYKLVTGIAFNEATVSQDEASLKKKLQDALATIIP